MARRGSSSDSRDRTGSYGLEVNILTQRIGDHGEMTLDSDSGTILRLTVITNFEGQRHRQRAHGGSYPGRHERILASP
jgi:hypothetical protein